MILLPGVKNNFTILMFNFIQNSNVQRQNTQSLTNTMKNILYDILNNATCVLQFIIKQLIHENVVNLVTTEVLTPHVELALCPDNVLFAQALSK